MAKRRYSGWGRPFWSGKKSRKYGDIQMYSSGGWKIRRYDKGVVQTWRLSFVSEKKR